MLPSDEDYELYWMQNELRGASSTAGDVPPSVAGALPHCLRANEWCVPSGPISSDDPKVLHRQRQELASSILRLQKLSAGGI